MVASSAARVMSHISTISEWKPGPVEQADRRDLQVVDQRTDVDPAVLVGVLVGPVLQVCLLEREPLGIGVHHELLAGPGEDQHLVLRVRTDRLQHLPE